MATKRSMPAAVRRRGHPVPVRHRPGLLPLHGRERRHLRAHLQPHRRRRLQALLLLPRGPERLRGPREGARAHRHPALVLQRHVPFHGPAERPLDRLLRLLLHALRRGEPVHRRRLQLARLRQLDGGLAVHQRLQVHDRVHGHVPRRLAGGERLLLRHGLLPGRHPQGRQHVHGHIRGQVQHVPGCQIIQPLQLRGPGRGRGVRLPHRLRRGGRRLHGVHRRDGAAGARLGCGEGDVPGGEAERHGLRLRQRQQWVRRSRNGPGYLCNCSIGYQGNPYLLDGCRDINECEDKSNKYPCSVPGTCINTPGGFSCACPDKTTGNAYTGTCEAKKSQLGVHIAIGISVSVVVLVISMSCACMIREKMSLDTVKRRYFKQHGGLLLFEEMKSKQGISFTLFTREELEEATGKFDERNVLGKGGNGTVYKGTLKDGRTVAIKKCKLINERQKKEFGKEMLILSQINHRNIVKLYGCCLEVEVPMLVYEFIPNGTLYQLIHGGGGSLLVPFTTRLKIAHEAAEALAYLHSWASPPIIHGDVKSPNILIDESYAVKVADFGASTLAPTDEAQLVTFVQGTCGYLDPEYMQTCKLTDRSDVYSFGVVLLELLTRKKALNLQATEDEDKILSSHFLLAANANRLDEIVDAQIVSQQSIELIEQMAELAKQCLRMDGEKRPSMREVAEELGRLRKLLQHPWGQQSSGELERLLVGSPNMNSEIELSHAYISFDDSAYIGVQSPR